MLIKSNKRKKRTVWSDEKFLLSVHSPATIPTLGNLDYKAFSTSKDVIILTIPKLIVPEKNFHSLKPSTKGCLFSHERRLSIFRFYSQKNCLLECRLNCTIRKCGCVTFNQPRFNTTDICGKPKYRDCLTGVWCGHCNCLPDCVSLDYTIQLKEHGLKKNVNEHSDVHFRLKVVYKYNTFSTTLRHSINSMEEFIAYSAGILGVFNGFSIMALWEIMYFVVLRIWGSIRRIN
ncbi:pickpocket protein 28-like [Macrosteles quadrilineatus]|uniref:pickpocket protein 28-like n=1 Tax=Macrosteles quadrilineatus TaxID=74068 RepID=UPI0023E0A239|nr:pickpocket protein 28-like [Macrosteles quadrilineatus]